MSSTIDSAGIVRRAAARARALRSPAALHARAAVLLAADAAADPDEAHARRMAADMRDIAAAKGTAEEADLVLRGWTGRAIARLGPRATEIANGDAVRVQ